VNIKQIELKKEKALEEYNLLENNSYKLSEYYKYITDIKRLECLKVQISMYDEVIFSLKDYENNWRLD